MPNVTCRLLYVVGRLHTGGLERQLYYLLRSMDRERYKPAVAAWNFSEQDLYVGRIRELGVPVYSFPNEASGFEKLGAFRDLVGQLEPEVVHSYSFYTNFSAHWAARGRRIVAVGSVRSDFLWAKTETGPCLGRLSAYYPRHQIFNSYSAAQTVSAMRSPFVPRHFFVVRNSIDFEHFHDLPLQTNGPACILGVGYLLPIKRWERLLLAAQALKLQGLNCLIRIAGDGPLRNDLEDKSRALGLAPSVTFLGHIDKIHDLLAEATFLVHTADSEGCPNAVMEAMACGRAVVATDAGDIPMLVENGKSGFVVGHHDKAALVERMATLISDRELCRSMGQLARAKAEREFGLGRLVEETLAVYRSAGWREASTDSV